MEISSLLTSAAINIAICVALVSLYSILRKQPCNISVYFGRKITAPCRPRHRHTSSLDRFVPSPSWIMKAWEATDEEILASGGVDGVVFMRIIVFSIRIFAIAASICMFLVLPINYYGQEMHHKKIHAESLDVFTIANVKEGSKWLWAHCLALYVISCAACVLLYYEYKSITKLRLAHIIGSPPNPSHFTVLVRGIPWSATQSYSETVKEYFSKYYESSYLSHGMVYRASKVQKLMNDAEKMYKKIKLAAAEPQTIQCQAGFMPSFFFGDATQPFKKLQNKSQSINSNLTTLEVKNLESLLQECPSAFVFFKTRFAAVIAAQVLQSSNPMLWVTKLAPEPLDVYWSNLWIPYRQLWLRKIAVLLAAITFMFVFIIPVAIVQSLTQLQQLSHAFPFLREILQKKFMIQVVTGYLPSVVLILFLYTAPPLMLLFSKLEGFTSRSARKKSACIKVLYFTIWNVFFVNLLSGSIIRQISLFANVRDMPTQLAMSVTTQVTFFMTYVLSSGWASLACELILIFTLIRNLTRKYILRIKEDSPECICTFPYQTEIPRLLLFGLLGFTYSVMAPLILPFLLGYYLFAYLVYRNQILNVYVTRYETGGRYWPIVHNSTIFSLVLMQIIALGVFGLKKSPVASGFTIPLIILTLLFNEYCRQRFVPVFQKRAAQILIEMDRTDQQSGKLEEIYRQLRSAYCQFPLRSHNNPSKVENVDCHRDPESLKLANQLVDINEESSVDISEESSDADNIKGGTSGKETS